MSGEIGGAGEAHPRARLTWRQVEEIRASTETHEALARRYGVHPTHISLIRRGLRWRTARPQ